MRPHLPPRLVHVLSLTWVPLTASFLSLMLSLTSIVISTREPEVLLLMPDLVRVAQGEDFGRAFLYLQPAFVNTGQNDRVEVISDMILLVEPVSGGETVEFSWDEQAQFVDDDPQQEGLGYKYAADAVPLLISPSAAQSPIGLFNAPADFYFGAETYRFTLRATRVVATAPLEGTFEVSFAADQIEFLNESKGHTFLAFDIDSD